MHHPCVHVLVHCGLTCATVLVATGVWFTGLGWLVAPTTILGCIAGAFGGCGLGGPTSVTVGSISGALPVGLIEVLGGIEESEANLFGHQMSCFQVRRAV